MFSGEWAQRVFRSEKSIQYKQLRLTIARIRTNLIFLIGQISSRLGGALSDCGKKVRLLRVLGGVDHRALVVAFDHALGLGPIHGTENPLAQICRFAEAQVDALLLNLGLIRQFANTRLPRSLPPIIARIDWTVAAGAAGVFFGRNVFQAPNMGSFLQQARAILQGVEVPQTRR